MSHQQNDLGVLVKVVPNPNFPRGNNIEVSFKIKRTTKLSVLQNAYADKVGRLDPFSLRWSYNGEWLHPDDTPGSLGMQDNDIINVRNEMKGD